MTSSDTVRQDEPGPISITVISDTHLRHRELTLPEGDILIHCGDMFNLNTRGESAIADLDTWFGEQAFAQILCVGGNHDHVLQDALQTGGQPFANARCLVDETYRYAGLNIHGSPWIPDLKSHAFYKDEIARAQAWARIPADTDILITHTPPFGMLDRSSAGHSHGCFLLGQELARIKCAAHCFGHVHASAGARYVNDVLFINGSSIESGTKRMLDPVTFTAIRDAEGRVIVHS